jgi:hypothetical protein
MITSFFGKKNETVPKRKLARLVNNFVKTVPKIRTVILSEAKNLVFFFPSQKIKKEILRPYGFRMTRKDKFTKILEYPLSLKLLLTFFQEE